MAGRLGLAAADVRAHVEHVGHALLVELGAGEASPWAHRAAPVFEWMGDAIRLEGKTNFFEQRVSEYRVGALSPGSVAEALAGDVAF